MFPSDPRLRPALFVRWRTGSTLVYVEYRVMLYVREEYCTEIDFSRYPMKLGIRRNEDGGVIILDRASHIF